jgi:membrane-bound serine protease (ClpP class)
MKRIYSSVVSLFLLPWLLSAQTVVSIRVDGVINPVTAQFIHRGIEKAQAARDGCLLIELNTPGGLLKSTRVIVGDLLESPVPVIVFVSPAGAHAGSAGVFLTLAAHIAAMAPGTNLGAAHPVDMQGKSDEVMNDKVTNDAAAFIRTIAGRRKRNAQWAEDAVRKSIALTDSEALQENVVDLLANNTDDLLSRIDGKTVETSSGMKTLHTRGAPVDVLEMSAIEKMLDLLSDPNIAYILLLMGLFGVLFELYNPGSILPGIVGVIALVLAFYSLHSLPINYAGLALILFALILFLLEIKIASHGLLAIGGVVSLLLGSMMLIRTGSTTDVVKISRTLILSGVAVTTLFFLGIIGMGLKAQRNKPVTGVEGMQGEIGTASGILDTIGLVRIHGETWRAESVAGTIRAGARVRVLRVENLTLYVEPVQ